MSDLIDRLAAIAVINGVFPVDPMKSEYAQGIACGAALAKTYVEQLPSAQPEIIYCKNCKYWTETCGDKQWGLGDCDVFDKHLVMLHGYCAWAERREE